MSADLDNPNLTYAAVGRATSAWETLETHLSYLYTIFVEKPLLIDAIEEYGRDRVTFLQRTKLLDEAATNYFKKNPNQSHEGALRSLIKEAEELAPKRHQIAHGIVHMIPTQGTKTEDGGYWIDRAAYVLKSPWHALYNLTRKGKDDYYRWGSQDLDEITKKFYACAERAEKPAGTLSPPKP
jgi:hypothetical protein